GSVSLRHSGASSLIGTSDTALQEKSSVDSKTGLDKLLPYILPFSIILFLLIAIMWFIIVKKLRNTQEKAEQYIQARDWHLQRLAVRSEVGRKKNNRYSTHEKYINRHLLSQILIDYRISTGTNRTFSNLFWI